MSYSKFINHKTLGIVTLALTMVACGEQRLGRQEPQAPQLTKTIQAQNLTLGETIRTVQADLDVNTTTTIPGLPSQTARPVEGVKIAYRFSNEQVKTRIDAAGSNFTDGRARIITFDRASGAARVLFGDTKTADPALDATQLARALQEQTTGSAELLDPTRPFTRKSAATFQQGAQLGGASTQIVARDDGSVGTLTTATRVETLATGAKQTSVLTFDPNVGAVTRVQTLVEGTDMKQDGTTRLTYAAVANMPNVSLPVRFTTQQTVLVKSVNQTATVTQDLAYNNVVINTLPDSFFDVEGQ